LRWLTAFPHLVDTPFRFDRNASSEFYVLPACAAILDVQFERERNDRGGFARISLRTQDCPEVIKVIIEILSDETSEESTQQLEFLNDRAQFCASSLRKRGNPSGGYNLGGLNPITQGGIPMEGIVLDLSRRDKRRLLKTVRKCKDARLKTRYQIVLNVVEGRSAGDIAAVLGVAASTVRRVVSRYVEAGEAGLVDRREENGPCKLSEEYLSRLYEIVADSAENYGWRRPTWTRELLAITMERETGIRVHVGTMSRALKAIGARRGRPKPTVACPWSEPAKRRKLQQIRRLIAKL